jgi:hypothetical protein
VLHKSLQRRINATNNVAVLETEESSSFLGATSGSTIEVLDSWNVSISSRLIPRDRSSEVGSAQIIKDWCQI